MPDAENDNATHFSLAPALAIILALVLFYLTYRANRYMPGPPLALLGSMWLISATKHMTEDEDYFETPSNYLGLLVTVAVLFAAYRQLSDNHKVFGRYIVYGSEVANHA
jgi:hypothetical protein